MDEELQRRQLANKKAAKNQTHPNDIEDDTPCTSPPAPPLVLYLWGGVMVAIERNDRAGNRTRVLAIKLCTLFLTELHDY